MPMFVRDPMPIELQELVERRRRLGLDRFDEIWEGVLHMIPTPAARHGKIELQLGRLLEAPAERAGLTQLPQFNLGVQDDFRIPDGGLLRELIGDVWHPTAALVIEILSPGDETWSKFDFYAAHDVDEIVIVDPETHTVQWLARAGDCDYEPTEQSAVIELGPAELAAAIDWP